MKPVRPWHRRGVASHFEHPLLSLKTHDLEADNGDQRQALVVEAPGWVNMVAITPEERVVMVRQWRFGVAVETLEIPGGMIDPGESPREAAERELYEETGFRAARWTEIGVVQPNPALFDNLCTTFLGTGLERLGEPPGDGDEEIEVVEVPLAEIPNRIACGEIAHALVVAAFYFHAIHSQTRGPIRT